MKNSSSSALMKMMMKILQIERQFIAKKWTQLVTKLPARHQAPSQDSRRWGGFIYCIRKYSQVLKSFMYPANVFVKVIKQHSFPSIIKLT